MTWVYSKSKSKFEKRTTLRGKATLPLWNEPSHDYVGLSVTEIIYGPVGLCFLGLKSKISHEQNVIYFQFYIRLLNCRLLSSIIFKKSPIRSIPLSILYRLFFETQGRKYGRILSWSWPKGYYCEVQGIFIHISGEWRNLYIEKHSCYLYQNAYNNAKWWDEQDWSTKCRKKIRCLSFSMKFSFRWEITVFLFVVQIE